MEANVLLQMSEVNEMGTHNVIPPGEETKEEKKKGKKGFFGAWWKPEYPKWFRHNPAYRRRSPHPVPTTSHLNLLFWSSVGDVDFPQ